MTHHETAPSELLPCEPCPFCGCDADYDDDTGNISCVDSEDGCGFFFDTSAHDDVNDAIRFWNRRTTQAPAQDDSQNKEGSEIKSLRFTADDFESRANALDRFSSHRKTSELLRQAAVDLAELTRQRERISKYRARLEVDCYYVKRDGELVLVSEPDDRLPDAIDCRDATIDLLTERLADQEKINSAHAAVANNLFKQIESLQGKLDAAEQHIKIVGESHSLFHKRIAELEKGAERIEWIA